MLLQFQGTSHTPARSIIELDLSSEDEDSAVDQQRWAVKLCPE